MIDCLPISVIIPTKNAENTLEECLLSIQNNNPTEIIVVDGLSTDRTLEIAQKYTHIILSDEGKGASYAHQIGAELATQQYVAYVDADIVLPEGVLAKLLAEVQSTKCISMAATVVAAGMSTYWERAVEWNNILLRQRRHIGGLQATVILRDIIIKIGFDSSIVYGDDFDFTTRVHRAGYEQCISPTIVYHHHRTSVRNLYRARLNYSRVIPRLMKKYGIWQARLWPPVVAAYWIYVCILRGKTIFIPYFVVNGVAQTMGMIKGILELFV
jgi:glycosyltransferase involved in cell wall biosynthesis